MQRHSARQIVPRILVLLVTLSPCHPVTLSPCQAGGAENLIDAPMYRAPDLPGPRVVTVFPEKALPLWRRALERPEVDLRCQAATAVIRARRRGVRGLEPMVAPLRAALEREEHPAVRLAVVRALISLDARAAAPALFRQAREGGSVMRDLVEPALARWDYRPARAVWLERLAEAAAPPRSLVLAIRSLAEVREGRASDRLRELALSARVSGPIRLEAARALGLLRTEGLATDAARLTAEASPRGLVDRLVAATLLRRHRDKEAVALLQRLTRDTEPAVVALAAGRLLEIDPDLALEALPHLLANPDAKVRALGVEVVRRRPTAARLRLLGDRLDDPHPEVRAQARRALRELAGKEGLRAGVLAEATRLLAAPEWRGQEQAALLLGQLDHKPAAGRLVELLQVDRPEVFVAAAWGLRKLAVPATFPAVVDHVQARWKEVRTDPAGRGPVLIMLDHQLSQLNQLLGEQKYRPAEPLLRQFVPRMKFPVGGEARAAAIWALGLILQGKEDGPLASALEGRLNDIRSIPPEDLRVRRMCAVTLGRLKAKETLPSLEKFCPTGESSADAVGNACGWAIEQMTGRRLKPPRTIRQGDLSWFLTPLGDRPSP
jgi:HEAT repeat protein